MPGTAPASPSPARLTPPAIRTLQLTKLQSAAAKFGFEPLLNELPYLTAPEPAEPADAALRRHLSHLRLAGTVLDPDHMAKPLLPELRAIDGVPLLVETMDRFPPLERCILCGGAKGETYTICAGCYTTQSRFFEHALLQLLPDIEERSLAGAKAITHEQFVRAIVRTPRLQPRRRGRLEPGAADIRSRALDALAAAARTTRLEAMRSAAADPALTPKQRARLQRQLRSAEAAKPWSGGEYHREAAKQSLDGPWLDLLARGDSDETGVDNEAGAEDDDYPVEWLVAEWLGAPDRVTSLDELSAPFVPRANTAAGGPEHAAALQRNALLGAWSAARARMLRDPDAAAYARWLAGCLEDSGRIPLPPRSRRQGPWDADECERWDRWVDAILGGNAAPDPAALAPFDAGRCRLWGEAVTTTESGGHDPVFLPRLDRGLPSGRLRWPQFIREEIEAEFAVWGRWAEIHEADGSIVRAWIDPEPGPTPIRRPPRRRLIPGARKNLLQRRLEEWAQQGAAAHRAPAPATVPRPRGSRTAWECEIRRELRRRRFERMARASSLVHRTHIEHARMQNH
jgi:hypothetical protein